MQPAVQDCIFKKKSFVFKQKISSVFFKFVDQLLHPPAVWAAW